MVWSRSLLCLFALPLIGAPHVAAADQGLLGSTVSWQYWAYGSAYDSATSFVVNGGVGGTFTSDPGKFFHIRADNDSITFDYPAACKPGNWTVSGLSLSPTIHNGIAINMVSGPTFRNVTIDPSTNMAGFDATRISFTANQIQVDWQELSFSPGTIVKLHVEVGKPLSEWISFIPSYDPPSPRADASAVYNAAANQMVVFGGNTAGCSPTTASLNDTWVLSGANGLQTGTQKPASWSQVQTVGGPPPGRLAHTAVYNSAQDSMLVFGGGAFGCSASKYNDVWILENTASPAPSWRMLMPPGALPPARSDHVAVYDEANDRMIIFGGIGTDLTNLTDLWVLSNASGATGTPEWTSLTPSGTGPTDTAYMAATYDPGLNEMTLFAGWSCCAGPASNQAWVLSNANGLGGTPQWSSLAPVAGRQPPPLIGPRGVYDPASAVAWYFGGSQTNAIWRLIGANGATVVKWSKLLPSGAQPPVRGGLAANPTMILDPASGRVVVFGGAQRKSTLNDTWIFAP